MSHGDGFVHVCSDVDIDTVKINTRVLCLGTYLRDFAENRLVGIVFIRFGRMLCGVVDGSAARGQR